ncbi:MAG: hypothetical protein FWC12_12445 [Treponema sp.]|nr:hypothetical protein [Treponema sp.]
MGLPSLQGSLWKVALECAFKRSKKKCENEFDSPVCNSCKYYINNYIEEDPRKVKLYMMSAEDEVVDIEQTLKRADRTIIFTIISILGILFIMWFLMYLPNLY